MAGLLDGFGEFIKTPEGQGLLSAAFGGLAGAQNGKPLNSLGRAGMAGLSGYGNAIDRDILRTKEASQQKMLELQTAAAQRKADLISQYVSSLLPGASQAPQSPSEISTPAQSPSVNGGGAVGGAVGGVSAPMPQGGQPNPLGNIPKGAALSDLIFNDGKQLGQWGFELAKPSWQNVNGNMVNTNDPSFKGGFQKGMSTSANGQTTLTVPNADGSVDVVVPKGALDAVGAFKSAELRAQNQNTLAPSDRIDPTTGRPYAATVDQLIQKVGRGNGVQLLAKPGSLPVNDPEGVIAQDAAENSIQNPVTNFKGRPGSVANISSTNGTFSGFAGPGDLGEVKNITEAGGKINDTWLKTSYEPTIQAGQAAQSVIDNTQIARDAMRKMGGTGWGTDTKAAAANMLTGLGIASKNSELYASNAQVFQKAASERLWSVLNNAKGPQTEGDAARAAKTYGQLGNTTNANEFIFDLAQATAEREKAKAAFFSNALPIAKQNGDLSEVEREWNARMPSIFNMPSMKRWNK